MGEPGPGLIPEGPFGDRVRRRLEESIVAWFTTASRDGTPQPNLVWFIWDGDSFLIYNRPEAVRLQHLRRSPRATLHLDSDGRGGDEVIFTGTAEIVHEPPPHEVPAYVAKYSVGMDRVSGSLEAFSRRYAVAVRFRPDRLRGF